MNDVKIKKIPKKIHFIWFGKNMPWYIKNHIQLVKQKYKDYKFKIWTEKDFDPNSSKYTKLAYKSKKYAFVSDYLRVKILFEEGGIYLDTDMTPTQDVRPLLEDEQMVLGFEYSKMISTGFVASIPGHPLFKKILETYDAFDHLPDDEVKFIINNELWTYFLTKIYGLEANDKEQILITGIKIFPSVYFSEPHEREGTYFLHEHKLSWTSRRKAKTMFFFLHKIVKPGQRILKFFLEIQKKIYFNKNRRIIKKQNKTKKELENIENSLKKEKKIIENNINETKTRH